MNNMVYEHDKLNNALIVIGIALAFFFLVILGNFVTQSFIPKTNEARFDLIETDLNIIKLNVVALNYLSRCIVDQNSLREVDYPIGLGLTEKAVVVTLICPKTNSSNRG